MPSGRWIDSILITSAPNAANEWVADGPAQNAVRSMIRTPASGSSVLLMDVTDSLGCQRVWLSASPSTGAGRDGSRRSGRHPPRSAWLPESRRVVEVDAALTQVIHLRNG